MDKLKICLLLACCVVAYSELLGPEENEESKKKTDDEDALSFLQMLLDQDLKDMRKQMTEEPADEPSDEASEIMSQWVKQVNPGNYKGVTQYVEKRIKPNFLQPEEGHEELLKSIAPIEEEEEEEDNSITSPIDLEAKVIYDAAIARLNRRPPNQRSAILEVKRAADLGYVPARARLAWAYLYGEGIEMDTDKAKEIFEELSLQGNAEAHAGMGFLHATGTALPVSPARALVHYSLGALGGSTSAQMALAYRLWAGVGVQASCSAALQLYMRVAWKVASGVSAGGGLAVQRVRITDESESADTDLIEYYQLLAEKGDVNAQVGLGQLHFQGGRGVTLDVSKALHYFTLAANAGHAVANAFLGKIYLEGGDGVRADDATAMRYFRKSADMNNAVGQAGLGLMYLQGRGGARDLAAAFKYFTLAANQGWSEGQLYLGYMYFSGTGVTRDYNLANKYFSLASQSGHVLALQLLATMHALGLGVPRSCATAVELYKSVCERGPWGARLMAAHAAWRAGNAPSAYRQYLALAEMGYEVAQSNAAYLLDSGEVTLHPTAERFTRALQLWGRSAAQGHAPARVKCGDYHYYGLGTPPDLEAAAHHYRIASEQQHNAQAMFNLGYMHERGLGLARDPHLAKRCYDLAADASPEARLPAALALAALSVGAALDNLRAVFEGWTLSEIFLGDDPTTGNWDLWLMGALLATLGVMLHWRGRN